MSEPTPPHEASAPIEPAAAIGEVAGPLEVAIPVGGRVLVASDLHLDRDPTPTHIVTVAELVQAVDSWSGPGVLLLNGNTFEPNPVRAPIGAPRTTGSGDVAAALAAHPRLETAIKSFSGGPGRRVVVLPGDRDADLAWSSKEQQLVKSRLGADVAVAVELQISAGAGQRRVRVEAGQQLDPLAVCQDPTNPGETPLSYHLRTELLPAIRRSEAVGSAR